MYDIFEDNALDQLREELLALEERELVPLNTDLTNAAMVVLGALPEILAHGAALEALFGNACRRNIDRLGLVARAALHADARYRAGKAQRDIGGLLKRVRRWRSLLRAEVRLLVARGLLPATIDRGVTRGQGFAKAGLDVLQLVAALRQNWSGVEDRTGMREEELDEAETDVSQLAQWAGEKKMRTPSDEALMRVRAYTLLSSTYAEVRRDVAYLRWKQGDGDDIAPPYLGVRRKHRKAKPAAASALAAK